MFQVVCLYCATSFGRCYPGGAALITEQRALFNGVSQLLAVAPAKDLKKHADNVQEEHSATKEDASGDVAPVEGKEEAGG